MTEDAGRNEYGDCADCDGSGHTDCDHCDAGAAFNYDATDMLNAVRRCRICNGRGRVACPQLPHAITTD